MLTSPWEFTLTSTCVCVWRDVAHARAKRCDAVCIHPSLFIYTVHVEVEVCVCLCA